MIDMKRKPEPKPASASTMLTPAVDEYEEPAYPYGLKIVLQDEQLDALRMELPQVGKTMTITCQVQVVGVRQEQETEKGDDSSSRCVNLQITAIDLGTAPAATREQRMYGG